MGQVQGSPGNRIAGGGTSAGKLLGVRARVGRNPHEDQQRATHARRWSCRGPAQPSPPRAADAGARARAARLCGRQRGLRSLARWADVTAPPPRSRTQFGPQYPALNLYSGKSRVRARPEGPWLRSGGVQGAEGDVSHLGTGLRRWSETQLLQRLPNPRGCVCHSSLQGPGRPCSRAPASQHPGRRSPLRASAVRDTRGITLGHGATGVCTEGSPTHESGVSRAQPDLSRTPGPIWRPDLSNWFLVLIHWTSLQSPLQSGPWVKATLVCYPGPTI